MPDNPPLDDTLTRDDESYRLGWSDALHALAGAMKQTLTASDVQALRHAFSDALRPPDVPDVVDPSTFQLDAVERFYKAVNARAEADILAGRPVTGAHHRALDVEIDVHRGRK